MCYYVKLSYYIFEEVYFINYLFCKCNVLFMILIKFLNIIIYMFVRIARQFYEFFRKRVKESLEIQSNL